jgi:hypothetical protein
MEAISLIVTIKAQRKHMANWPGYLLVHQPEAMYHEIAALDNSSILGAKSVHSGIGHFRIQVLILQQCK